MRELRDQCGLGAFNKNIQEVIMLQEQVGVRCGPTVKILIGDAVEMLRLLPSESVHCVVTSPPY